MLCVGESLLHKLFCTQINPDTERLSFPIHSAGFHLLGFSLNGFQGKEMIAPSSFTQNVHLTIVKLQ